MAADRIVINRDKQAGNQTVSLVGVLAEVREKISLLKGAANHGIGAGPVYTVLESDFGLQAGAGANFVTLLGYMDEIFNSNTTVSGDDRINRIQEFIDRIILQ